MRSREFDIRGVGSSGNIAGSDAKLSALPRPRTSELPALQLPCKRSSAPACIGTKMPDSSPVADLEQTEVGSYFVANYPPFSVWTP